MRVQRIAVLGLAVSCGGSSASIDDAAPPTVDADLALDASSVPSPAPGLQRWIVGDPADRVTTSHAGLILMGGGTDVDAAFAWQRDRIGGGDVVVLRASGADGYNAYLFDEIGGVDSVETLLVDSRELANEPYVAWALARAEAIFLAGGDQAVYVAAWAGTPVATALSAAWTRGAVLGGTSAGCAVLPQFVYAATAGSVYSDEALADPYDMRMTLVRDVLAVPPLAGVITDTHFGARDRMGRLLAFTARAFADGWSTAPIGLGVDEQTALVVDETGQGVVLGDGTVYALEPQEEPARCAAGTPLMWTDVPLHRLHAGDAIELPSGATTVPAVMLSASGGVLAPADPY